MDSEKRHIPVRQYTFKNYNAAADSPRCTQTSGMAELTCSNHPTARYLTKNPHQRSLHFIEPCQEWKDNPKIFGGPMECPCPFSDLVVVVDLDEYDRWLEIHAAENEAETEAGFDDAS